MIRSGIVGLAISICCVAPMYGQAAPPAKAVMPSIEDYFTGKMVVVKVDMPGTEKGVDLDFEKAVPLDWNPYSSRLTEFGVAIHKGDTARVTKIAQKSDHIEFQLDGGGYGTFGEDTTTTVKPKDADKSSYEKDLEKQLKAAKDPKTKQDLQTQLDKEVEKREALDAANKAAAAAATQVKVQELAGKRAHGGSRFNLNFKRSIPNEDRNPDAVMKLLADYVDFSGMDPNSAVAASTGTPAAATAAAAVPVAAVAPAPAPSPAQLKQGMKMDDVNTLLGQGQQMSQSTSPEGLKTQVMEYKTPDNVVDVTFVEGVVVKYSINSK